MIFDEKGTCENLGGTEETWNFETNIHPTSMGHVRASGIRKFKKHDIRNRRHIRKNPVYREGQENKKQYSQETGHPRKLRVP